MNTSADVTHGRTHRALAVAPALFALVLAAILAAVPVYAGDHGGHGAWNTTEDGVAIGGYDAVAYFSQYEAVKGDSKYHATYQGATFHFASAANRDAFVATPKAYTPKYGGYCAFAVGEMNKKVPANPETFKLYNGELLLFFDGDMMGKPMNTIIPWSANEKALHEKAETNWQKLG